MSVEHKPSSNGSSLRRSIAPQVRRLALTAGGLVGRVVDPVAVAWLLTRSAPDPARAARDVVVKVAGLLPPTPVDVVAGYLEGRVLFGRPEASTSGFEWHRETARAVTTAATRQVPKRLRAVQRRAGFDVRFDSDIAAVMRACRRGDDSWITERLVDLYRELQVGGFATTVTVHHDGEMVGGLWGIEVGRTFGIMSVFHRADHAGTIAQIAVFDAIGSDERWDVVDNGVLNEHYARFGAVEVTVEAFSAMVLEGLRPVVGSAESHRSAESIPDLVEGTPIVGGSDRP